MTNLAAVADLLLALIETQQNQIGLMHELLYHFDPSAYDHDALTLARAIQGEGAGDFGEYRDEMAHWIAHTAYNRWEKPWWKKIDGVDCSFSARVELDWHGTENVTEEEVEPWARRIAYQVLRERRAGGIDRANGALFGMSFDDLQSRGWLERAREMAVYVVAHPDDPLTQFWFLENYPGPEEGEDK